MEEIALKMKFSAAHSSAEVRKVLSDALLQEAKLAETRRIYFGRLCQAFEQQHHMTSDSFLQQFESGELGDDVVYFDWYAAKRGLDLWQQRFHILSEVHV
ncbi:MAG: hypothetical protein ACP5J4_09955 [Anaerolineae bacterium]